MPHYDDQFRRLLPDVLEAMESQLERGEAVAWGDAWRYAENAKQLRHGFDLNALASEARRPEGLSPVDLEKLASLATRVRVVLDRQELPQVRVLEPQLTSVVRSFETSWNVEAATVAAPTSSNRLEQLAWFLFLTLVSGLLQNGLPPTEEMIHWLVAIVIYVVQHLQ